MTTKYLASEKCNDILNKPVSDTLEVEMGLEILGLEDVAYTLHAQIEHTYNRILPDMQERIRKYLYTTFVLALWFTNRNSDSLRKYPNYRGYNVPPIWMYILSLVGNVYDSDTNVLIKVREPEVDLSQILTGEEMQRFSFEIGTYQRASSFVPFTPSEHGSPEFMSMIVLDGEIRSRKTDHPVYALASSILQKHAYADAYKALCRVSYGDVFNLSFRAREWMREFIGE